MILIVRGKDEQGADEKMLLRLGVNHEFLHSNRIDDIKRRVFADAKSKIPPSKRKIVKHIVFSLNYMFEHSDTDFLSLLEQFKSETSAIDITFYYFTDDEYLINHSIEKIKELGFTHFLVAQDNGDYLKQLNTLIIENGYQTAGNQKSSCITVGVLGGCQRIGTTTQAMQTMMFLQKTGYRVGLIQWQATQELWEYVEVVKGARHLSDSEFVINGLHFYGMNDVKTALNDNDYLLFDFGNIGAIGGDCVDLFLQKDVKIAVLGVKSNEVQHMEQIFGMDSKGNMKYLYSFILQADRSEVVNQMGARKKDTYFTDYTPDYFTYSDNDITYSKMLGITIPEKPPQKKIFDAAKTQLESIVRSGKWNKKTEKNTSL